MSSTTERNAPESKTPESKAAERKQAGQARNSSFALSWAERLESLKAGMVGAIAAALIFGFMTLLNRWLAIQFVPLESWHRSQGWAMGISGAIAALSGFLFAVTYRYIVRQDANIHLKSGAVAAFGLVRGLAQLDLGVQAEVMPLVLPLLVLESLILFAGIQRVLDWAIARGSITTFPASSQE